MRKKLLSRVIVFLIFLKCGAVHTTANANDLNELELFYRCYGQIARQRPTVGAQTLINQVQNQRKTAVQSCMEVLRRAELTAVGRTEISSRTDSIALSVLHNFNSFHITWFKNKRFGNIGDNCVNDVHANILDPTQPALHITRSLFRSDVPFKTVFEGTEGFQAVRDTVSTTVGPVSGRSYVFNYEALDGSPQIWTPEFSPFGQLYGVAPATLIAPTMILQRSPRVRRNLDLNLKGSLGGGILGLQTYLLTTILNEPSLAHPSQYSSDGADRVPRRWAQAVYKDLLCRDLPVIRAGDAMPYVEETSSVTFRTSVSCNQCHASMDRLSNGIRDIRYASSQLECNYYSTPRNAGFFGLYKEPTVLPQESGWPAVADNNFHKRPPRGTLYYRSFDGKLVNKSFMGLDGLSSALTSEKDLYVCTAKKYFEFFTGVSVNLADIADPQNPVDLSAKEKAYRDQVIQLGLSLQSHQNLQELVREIISLPVYRKKDFGVGEQ